MGQESDPGVDGVTRAAGRSRLQPRLENAGSAAIRTPRNSSETGVSSSLAGDEAKHKLNAEKMDTQERSSLTDVSQERATMSFVLNDP